MLKSQVRQKVVCLTTPCGAWSAVVGVGVYRRPGRRSVYDAVLRHITRSAKKTTDKFVGCKLALSIKNVKSCNLFHDQSRSPDHCKLVNVHVISDVFFRRSRVSVVYSIILLSRRPCVRAFGDMYVVSCRCCNVVSSLSVPHLLSSIVMYDLSLFSAL